MSSDRLGSVEPTSVTTPMNVADLASEMRHAAAKAQIVGVAGAMTKIGQGADPTALDLLVSTRSMDRIVEHSSDDLVITVQSGVPLAALQDHVRGSGQWLALDPPEAGATVGGVVATASSGPHRLLYGTPRDLLIGITVVLADGTVARSGGKVVKNVAGYDLGKLFTGSFGTLGVIAECTFRLHPTRPARRVVTAHPEDLAAAAQRIFRTGGVPAALEWDGSELVAVFESIESAAQTQAEDAAAAVDGQVGDSLPPNFGHRPSGQVRLKVTHRLGALNETVASIRRVSPAARLQAQVGSGVIWTGAEDGDLSSLDELRRAVAPYDGGVVVIDAPAAAKRAVDVWGPACGLEVMRRIKDRFDPDHRMAPGRFVGGI
jgi:glycolate oxidase FAD binding subunit